jgi:hypothetical protein
MTALLLGLCFVIKVRCFRKAAKSLKTILNIINNKQQLLKKFCYHTILLKKIIPKKTALIFKNGSNKWPNPLSNLFAKQMSKIKKSVI